MSLNSVKPVETLFGRDTPEERQEKIPNALRKPRASALGTFAFALDK